MRFLNCDLWKEGAAVLPPPRALCAILDTKRYLLLTAILEMSLRQSTGYEHILCNSCYQYKARNKTKFFYTCPLINTNNFLLMFLSAGLILALHFAQQLCLCVS
jgi:hypothetical protein